MHFSSSSTSVPLISEIRQARELQRTILEMRGHNASFADTAAALPSAAGLGEPFGSCKRIWRPWPRQPRSEAHVSEEILTRVGVGGVSRSGAGGGGRVSCSGAGLAACEAIVLFDDVASHYDDDGDVTEYRYRERENVPVVTQRPARAVAPSQDETDAAAAVENLPVQLVMTLGLDFGMAGSEGSDTREKFKRDVAQDLATASGLAAANFNIKHVSAGSFVLEMEVLPDPLAPGAHFLAAQDLANQAEDTSSKLRSGKLTSHAIGVVVIPSKRCEAAFHDRLTREGGGGM